MTFPDGARPFKGKAAVGYHGQERESMAENEPVNDQDQPVKTTTDLAIEKMNARLDALEKENAELKAANRGLWAELHPVQPAPVQDAAQTPAQGNGPTDYDIVAKNLGWNKEE